MTSWQVLNVAPTSIAREPMINDRNRLLLFYIVLVVSTWLHLSMGQPKDTLVCQYSRQRKLLTVDCSDKYFEEVPTNIKSEVEVVDLSHNYIGELKNTSFTCCTNIKLLYLQYNSIVDIPSETFVPLSHLNVLDLSKNSINKMPINLPPTLQKLFLNSNWRMFDSQNPALPFSNSNFPVLDTLHLSQNKFEKFPRFSGSFLSLLELNVTANVFEEISAEDLAPLCRLKYLFVSLDKLFPRSENDNEQYCKCMKFVKWLDLHQIDTRVNNSAQKFSCRRSQQSESMCLIEFSNETLAIYNDCMAALPSESYRTFTSVTILITLIILMILLYIIRRKKQKQEISCHENGKTDVARSVKEIDSKTMEEK